MQVHQKKPGGWPAAIAAGAALLVNAALLLGPAMMLAPELPGRGSTGCLVPGYCDFLKYFALSVLCIAMTAFVTRAVRGSISRTFAVLVWALPLAVFALSITMIVKEWKARIIYGF